ncbi:MAG: alpha/beta hydrolase [Thermoleophilaceae bacterium]|nr:alpha/beta hydrolase [Thermoleophilaceae bacterium]
MPPAARWTRRLTMSLVAFAAVAIAAGCTIPRPVSESPRRYLDPVFQNVEVARDVTYGSAPGISGLPEALKLDVYQPAEDTVTRRPVLLWLHGGGFVGGDKSAVAGTATSIARLGYVVAAVNYRLLSPFGCGGTEDLPLECYAAAIGAQHDTQAAVRWLRRYAAINRVDPNRIASGGVSAGAIASLLADWRADDPGSSGNPGYPSHLNAAISVSGGVPTNQWIDGFDSPAMFFHGTEDDTVPYAWPLLNTRAMLDNGVPALLRAFEAEGHTLTQQGVITQQASYFLWHALGLEDAPR